MSKTVNIDLCRELLAISGWDNNASTGHENRLDMWVQRYSTWEMGAGNDDYGKPGIKQRGVDVGDWHVTDDPRHRVGIPEVVFNWWWDKVAKINANAIPAYDLDYLLNRLPKKFVRNKRVYGFVLTSSTSDGCWIADFISWTWQGPLPEHGKDHWLHNGDEAKLTEADNPADAVAKLVIQLFQKSILKRDDNPGRTTKTARSEDASDALAYSLLQGHHKTKKK